MSKHSEDAAQALLDTLVSIVDGTFDEETEGEPEEMALEVCYRSGWFHPGEELLAEEYMILTTTGGPAVRIVGSLDKDVLPGSAYVEHQDWGEPWERLGTSSEEQEALMAYVERFFY